MSVYFRNSDTFVRRVCATNSAIFHARFNHVCEKIPWDSRPSSTQEEYDEYGDQEYRAAEQLGEQVEGENCHTLYPECHKSVLDVFSALIT